jgi:alkylation response protein AidB-like acyl-CoA dehydrogenase
VPQKYGGLGLDLVTTCLIVEEVSKKMSPNGHVLQDAPSLIPTESQLERYIQPLLRGEMFAAAPWVASIKTARNQGLPLRVFPD